MRQKFDSKGWQDKYIGITQRFNAFINSNGSNRPSGFHTFPTDGEGLDIYNAMKDNYNTCLSTIIRWYNLMLYDIEPSVLGAYGSLDLDVYKKVFGTTSGILHPEIVMMGFEPGSQVKWEGINVDEDVIDYIQMMGYGGIFFWAINHP